MGIKVLITGSTGMVGEGVMHECLLHPDVEEVVVINRRSCGVSHLKLKEILHQDFSDFTSVENELRGFNAAFLCMGVSSVGMKKEKYEHLTYDLTMALAKPLAYHNPDITICYVSGAGTDSTEKGKIHWARVKGMTENHIMQLPIKRAYMFRPAMIIPTKGLKNTYTSYKVLAFLIPAFRMFFPNYICSLKEIGLAMINASIKGYNKTIIEVNDIKALAK
jgi:uncharacterized protein YbjT (DUF2867 family)